MGVRISHCPDALVVAWAPWRIGVDLEQSNRAIPAAALVKRFFCSQERDALSEMGAEPLRQAGGAARAAERLEQLADSYLGGTTPRGRVRLKVHHSLTPSRLLTSSLVHPHHAEVCTPPAHASGLGISGKTGPIRAITARHSLPLRSSLCPPIGSPRGSLSPEGAMDRVLRFT